MYVQPTVFSLGYTTKPLPNLPTPVFAGRKGTTDPDKIAAQIQEKLAAYSENVSNSGYTSCLQYAVLCEIFADSAVLHEFKPTRKAGVSTQLANFLGDRVDELGQTDFTLIGFDPKTFLKVLGIECLISKIPLSPHIWLANSNHYDVESLIWPEPQVLDLPASLMKLGLAVPAGWRVGQDARVDAELAGSISQMLQIYSMPVEA